MPLNNSKITNMPITAEQFADAIREILRSAFSEGRGSIAIRAGDLHKQMGDYPGPDHRMPACCDAMRSHMIPGDRFITQPPKGDGSNLVVEYMLPRAL